MNQKGILHLQLLVLLAIIGLVLFFLVATNAPLADRIYELFFPKPPSQAATTWAFEETWDKGLPTAPLAWSDPSRFDLVMSSNDRDGIVDGFVFTGGNVPIKAAHGPDCGAPVGRGALNNHDITPDLNNPQSFQTNYRKDLAYICNDHLMTAMHAGYGIASLMPRQLFDWNGRTGTIEIDTNTYGFGREWWDLYLVPPQDMLMSMATSSEGGTIEHMPRNAVKISFIDGKPSMYFIENYSDTDAETRFFRNWQSFADAFPNDPANTDPRIRRKFRFQVSQTAWKYQIEVDANAPASPPSGSYETVDGKRFWTFSGNFPKTLSFSQALMRLEHHAYNPTKDGVNANDWSQFTFHWDNFRFDGPVLFAHTAFEAAPVFVDMLTGARPDANKFSAPVSINVNVSQAQIRNARLVGELGGSLMEVDITNSSHWAQVRANGGAWTDISFVKKVGCGCDRSWSTFSTPLSNIIAGNNTIEFRYLNTPPARTWQPEGFAVKDIEIQIDPVGGVVPPVQTTPPTQAPVGTPTPQPPVTSAPTSIPTAVPPTGSTTVTFDDRTGQNQALTGQYPAGVLDWGTNTWLHSGPFGLLTTKNVSFQRSGVTSGVVTVLGGRSVVSVEAYNGGNGTTSVGLSCPGQTTKSFTLTAKQQQSLTTGWTSNCSALTIGSTNGWDTNFDNIVLSSGTSTPTTPPSTPPPTTPPTVPPTVTPPPTSGNGLSAVYYNNPDFTGTTYTRIDPTINFNWGFGSPNSIIGVDSWSARWTGFIRVTQTGTYTFYGLSDDGVRLWVNNVQVINTWRNQSATESSGTVSLTANVKYPVRLEYYDNAYDAVMQLFYAGPSTTKQIVPQSVLFSQ